MEENTNKTNIISLDLKKGMSLDLTKHDNTLKVMKIGLGWKTTYDLDVMAFTVDRKGIIQDTICYYNPDEKGISLDGDDRIGGKEGDCETLTVIFDSLPQEITKIMICANIYNAKPTKIVKKGLFHKKEETIEGDTFKNVKGSYIRLYNANTNIELCKYSLEEDGSDFNAFHFANLIKQPNGEWSFVTIGEGMNGSIEQIRKKLS